MNIKVKDLMMTQIQWVKPGDTVGKVKRIFKKNNVNLLPVLDRDENLVGVVSQGDLLLVENEFSQIHNHMHQGAVTIQGYANLDEAAHCMRKNHIHHLVVTHEKKVIGIISTYDLVKVLESRVYKYTLKNNAG